MSTLDAVDTPAFRQRVLFAFEVEWAKGQRPTAAEFAAQYASAGDRLLRELVVAEFRNRWKTGDAVPAELFLRKHYPQLRNDAEVILFLVAAEVEMHPGEADESGYVSRFPEQATDLREWFRLRREVSANWTSDPAVLASDPDQTIDQRRDHGVPAAFRAGEEFVVADRFSITRPLGEGGFKLVFEAVQRNAGRSVAFKVPKTAGGVGTVLDEGRVVAQLEHQNIPPVMTVGGPESGGIVAERLIQGREWRTVLKEQRQQRGSEADEAARLVLWRTHLRANLAVLLDVCKALRYVHERLHVIHRDVKPQNVMLGSYGEVYLVDWGLAVHVGDAQDDAVRAPHRSLAPGMCGTPAYMAPEMARGETGKLSLATDVFLLGATLHEVLCGKPPYAGPNLVLVFNLAQTRTFFPAEAETSEPVPSELAATVKKATAFDPAKRYPDAGAFAAAVEAYLAHADAEDRLRATAAEHETLKVGLVERRGTAPLYPLITPLIEVADQYSEAARDLGTSDAVAEVRGRAVNGEREARFNLVDLAEASGDFALAEAQLDRIARIPDTEVSGVAARRLAVQKQAARVQRTKWLFRGAAATAALLAVGVGIAVLRAAEFHAEREIAQLNEKAADARAANERLEKNAALTQAKFDEERRLADAKLEQDRKLADAKFLEARSRAEAKRSKAEVFSGLGRQLQVVNYDQAAMLSFAAAVEADDFPKTRRDLFDSFQSSLVPVAWATGRPAIGALAYTPDGQRLISGDFALDGTIRLWDLRSGEQVRTFAGHPVPPNPDGLSTVRRIVFHPANPDVIFSAGFDGTVLRTNIASGEQIRSASTGQPANVQFLSIDVSPRPGPDGRYRLVTGDSAKRVVIWDATTLQPLKVLDGQKERVPAVRFQPDGTAFVAGTGGRRIRFFDLEGNPTGELAVPEVPMRRGFASDLAFTPDGRFLATALDQPDLLIWNVAEKKIVHTLAGHAAGESGRGFVLRLAMAANGRLFSTGHDGTVREWDATAGTAIAIRARHEPCLEGMGLSLAIAVSPDGRELASTGSDYSLRRWNAADGALIAETRGQSRRLMGISAVVWAPRTDRLLALSSHGTATARLWDANRLLPLREETLGRNGKEDIDRVPIVGAFSPDEKTYYVAFGSGEVVEVDAQTGQVRYTYSDIHDRQPLEREAFGVRILGSVIGLAVTPDGNHLLTLGIDRKLNVWNIASRKRVRVIDLTPETSVLHFGPVVEPDGRHVLTLGSNGQLYRWNLGTGELDRTVFGHPTQLTAGQFSPDGKLFASGSEGLLLIWDAATWKPLHTFHLPSASEQLSTLHPRGSATGGSFNPSDRPDVNLPRNSALSSTYKATGTRVQSLSFSRDRRLLAATQLDGTINVIDVASGTLLTRAIGHTIPKQAPVVAIECRFTRENRLITAGDQGELIEWDFSPAPGCIETRFQDSLYGLAHSSDFSEWAAPGLSMGIARTPADANGAPAISEQSFFQAWYSQQRANWPKTEIARPRGKTTTLPDRPRIVQFVPNSTKLVVANEHGSAVVLEKEAIAARFAPPLRKPVWLRMQEAGKSAAADFNMLSTLAVEPRGELVAQGSRAGVVDLWRVADGSVAFTIDCEDRVPVSVAFRPVGPRHLTILFDDGNFAIWDVGAKQELFVSTNQPRGIGGEGKVLYAPDGKSIVHVGIGCFIAFYDSATGAVVQIVTGHRELPLGNGMMVAEIMGVAFGRGGDLMATCGSDGWVWLWTRDPDGKYRQYLTISTLKLASRLDPPGNDPAERDPRGEALPNDIHRQQLRYVVFGKDGTTLYTGGLTTPLYRIDLAAAERWLTRPPEEVVAETERVTGLRRTPDGLAPLDRNRMVFAAK